MTRPAQRSAGLSLIAALLLAACGTTSSRTPAATPSPAPGQVSASPSSPSASPSTSATASASASASGSASPSASIALPGQTETEWGRIWDELPSSFPVFPGQQPTETGEGPFSAQLVVPGEAGAAATWYQGALEMAGLSTLTMSGPLEDGGYVIESVGTPEACRVETRLTPHADGTLVSVLLAADCPFS